MRSLDLVNGWPGPRAMAGWVRRDGTGDTTGDAREPMAWASVTKLLTGMACLVAVEEGSVDLDEAAGPPGSTVRHLLAHASGLPMAAGGAQAAPGTRRIYSNLGFEVLADLVAARSAMAFADYLRSGVIEPLGLDDTVLDGSPAAGAQGSLTDLLSLGSELMAPTIVSPATIELATTVIFPGLDGVLPGFGLQRPNDWGLAFELADHKKRHWTGSTNSARTFGHFGQSGSFLWVDPVAGLACAGLADTDFGPWAAQAWPALSDAVVTEAAVGAE